MNQKMMMYVCPMHPEVMSDQPGHCPKCGMTLEPTEKEMAQVTKKEDTTRWGKFKMSMSMTMGMEHGGMAGQEMAKLMEEDIRNKFFVSLALTLPIIAYSPLGREFLKIGLPTPIPVAWWLFILTTPVFFYGGWIFLYSAYRALRNKTLNMAVLIATGITAAYGFSVILAVRGGVDSFYEAAAMLITFVLFGHWMEMKSRRGTSEALRALFDLVPPQARLIRDGIEVNVPTAEVKTGDILILKPGDKVPVDGVIIEGETTIDESLITGESLPVSKKSGDKIVGGSINQNGSVKFKATKVGSETVLAQIVKLVETAQNSKAPGQRLADRAAQYLVILAIGAGVITFLVWFFVMGAGAIVALTFAISAVVIACPDALGLATPTAVAVGTGIGAKHNILIKDAATLEQTSKIQAIVMDKTGTLTEGKPKITDIIPAPGYTAEQILLLEAAAEIKSNHPLSAAILEEVSKRKLGIPRGVKEFKSLSGLGLEAVSGSKHILVGTIKLMESRGVNLDPLSQEINNLLSEGKTIMLLAINQKLAGVAAAQDPVKTTAGTAVARMKELGIEVVMMTGDNQKTAEVIGKKLGIERIFAEVLPEDKANYVKKLQEEGKFTAMVGDGINDAPALAQADIGIAIGAGTDVAIETAKIVLLKSDPADVLRAIKLSKATVNKMKQNLVWASGYNVLAIPIAAGVLYPSFGITLRPEVAALLMSVSSIIVALNAVGLIRAEKSLLTV